MNDLAPLSGSRNLPTIDIDGMSRALRTADDAEQVVVIERQLDLLEQHMRDSGLYPPEQVRAVNELRMRARWKLGQLLAAVERAPGPHDGSAGPGRARNLSTRLTSFRDVLSRLGVSPEIAMRAQRIGTLPEPELEKALANARTFGDGFYASFAYLLDRARPFWYSASRRRKHQVIHANAMSAVADDELGPFPLIYADPPWKFHVHSDKGLDRTPDQHYPTLTDEQIADFTIGNQTVTELAARDAALLLWCTSSNVERALWIMEQWGFKFKASAVWVKDKSGLGLVFRNRHEQLLYGTRGNMPGPQYQPQSVFDYPRGRHSEKPAEIRVEIERMYPDFDGHSRLELFAREVVPGWTCRGFEAR